METVLRTDLGSALATRAVSAFTRVKLYQIAAPHDANNGRRNKLGHRYPGPRTAVVHFTARPCQRANSVPVQRLALLLLHLYGWLRRDRRLGWATGHPAQEHRLNVAELGKKCGIEKREVQRYLAVLEQAGLIARWQPPESSGALKGPSGHCFNLYVFPGGEPPAELVRSLDAWHGRATPRPAPAPQAAPIVRADDAMDFFAATGAWLKKRPPAPS